MSMPYYSSWDQYGIDMAFGGVIGEYQLSIVGI